MQGFVDNVWQGKAGIVFNFLNFHLLVLGETLGTYAKTWKCVIVSTIVNWLEYPNHRARNNCEKKFNVVKPTKQGYIHMS